MKEYYIFGASKLGGIALSLLENRYSIAGFLDNDRNKHNKEFCGKNVYNPEFIFKAEPNIIIASEQYKEIEKQLILNNVKQYKIFRFSIEDVDIDFDSKKYWEERYKSGGNSGGGSYNHLAEFKSKIINEFVRSNNINNVCEWGGGDGNQLSLMNYPNYIGYDVSKTAIEICKDKFKNDLTKQFILYDGKKVSFERLEKNDLALSLDVIYHLIEDEIYDTYMKNLFDSSSKYVCIYSTNYNDHHTSHVKDREFLSHVENKFPEWKLIDYIENEYLSHKVKNRKLEFSNSNFYFFEKFSEER
ncbi:methyltransferase domain-containing protein [Psychrobacillus sp.]|uniref:methyltransferase domain-containing protein n=1 Tax=Psychrobacillus sp. TaxID=1871623 RepID=UPI0028BDED64|nr:methyltransferase domain-containing protein [Psychrobacillus sp.]